jgi:4-oxalomesaconate tautomerase
MILRRGTSKGAGFLADNLPTEKTARDSILLACCGRPDCRSMGACSFPPLPPRD